MSMLPSTNPLPIARLSSARASAHRRPPAADENSLRANPSSAIAALTGPGLVSMKLASIRGSNRKCNARASCPVARERGFHQSRHLVRRFVRRRPTPLPSAPSTMSDNVTASSPDRTRKPSGRSRKIVMICERLPDASLIATMFSTSRASRRVVAASMFGHGSTRHVVENDGDVADRAGNRAKVRVESRPASVCCSRARPRARRQHPTSRAARALLTACAVELLPTPAMTRARPRATSTVTPMTRRFSSFAHRHALAGRPARHEHPHAARDLSLDQRPQAFLINRPVRHKRRHQRRRAPAQPFNFQSSLPPPVNLNRES